jgi:hypothetical protein
MDIATRFCVNAPLVTALTIVVVSDVNKLCGSFKNMLYFPFSMITVFVVTSKLKDAMLNFCKKEFLETDELTKVIQSELIFIVIAWAIITLSWAAKSS